ncbi:MAG: methyltransferase family protein [Sulfuricaulis sp.]
MRKEKSFVARGGIWVLAQVAVLLPVFFIPVWFGAGHFIPRHPPAYAGATLTALGVMLCVAGLAGLGAALTPFPRPLDAASLRRSGPYRLMRHPIYAGLIYASIGWALWWLSAAGLLYGVVVAVFFDRKSAHEEVWLREKYPDYADYERRVKKFLPGIY